MSLQERLDTALREKRELTALLRNDRRSHIWLHDSTATTSALHQRKQCTSTKPTSLVSKALQQLLREKAMLQQLRAERYTPWTDGTQRETEMSPLKHSVSADGNIPLSPTACKLHEERQKVRVLHQQSLEKLVHVRELARQKAELQDELHVDGSSASTSISAASQSNQLPTARPFTSSTSVVGGNHAQQSHASTISDVVSSTVIDSTDSLVYVGSFRPEEQDASGAVWPLEVESTVTLKLSRSADSLTTASVSAAEADCAIGFVLTRQDRIRRKQPVDEGAGEHVTTREWTGDCSLVPHQRTEHPLDGMTIEIDATLRARHRRNYHKPPAPSIHSDARNFARTRAQQQRQQQRQDHDETQPYDETLPEPVVRGGRIIASGHKFVVWGWGGDETVTLTSAVTRR